MSDVGALGKMQQWTVRQRGKDQIRGPWKQVYHSICNDLSTPLDLHQQQDEAPE